MSVIHKITEFDWVELLEPYDGAPAGARGGVLEFSDPETAMVEVMEPHLDGIDRILWVPLSKLRGLGPTRPPARA